MIWLAWFQVSRCFQTFSDTLTIHGRSPEFDQEMRELNADECVLETEVTNLGALGLYSDSAAYGETCVPCQEKSGIITCDNTTI